MNIMKNIYFGTRQTTQRSNSPQPSPSSKYGPNYGLTSKESLQDLKGIHDSYRFTKPLTGQNSIASTYNALRTEQGKEKMHEDSIYGLITRHLQPDRRE